MLHAVAVTSHRREAQSPHTVEEETIFGRVRLSPLRELSSRLCHGVTQHSNRSRQPERLGTTDRSPATCSRVWESKAPERPVSQDGGQELRTTCARTQPTPRLAYLLGDGRTHADAGASPVRGTDRDRRMDAGRCHIIDRHRSYSKFDRLRSSSGAHRSTVHQNLLSTTNAEEAHPR